MSGTPDTAPDEIARRLTAAGLEVESVEPVGHDIRGVLVAEVTGIEELTGFKKPVRYCQVSTGEGEPRGVICGAVNFAVGDRVPLAVPGASLPGGFEISAKKAYGRMSEGMICSAAELAIGDDHSGILVLPPDAPLGARAPIPARPSIRATSTWKTASSVGARACPALSAPERALTRVRSKPSRSHKTRATRLEGGGDQDTRG